MLVHVRDYTKGHPRIEANNHPIRHGTVVGIHNGIIVNDEEIFARYGFGREHPDMTVDSEAIFALAEHAEGSPEALEELYGAMATAWLDERESSTLFLARAVGRPLWIGTGGKELFFASTRAALEVLERTIRVTLRKREVDEGTLLRIQDGRVTRTRPLQARPFLRRGDGSPLRPRPARGRLLPQAPGRDRGREPLGQGAVRRHRLALLEQALPDEELEGGPRRLDVDHPVDLPLRQQALVGPTRGSPIGHLR